MAGGAVLTYGDINERSARAAGWLASQGVSTGDRVVVQLPKSVDVVALYLGVLRLGAVYVPLNPAYTSAEVDWFVADAEPAAVVQDPAALAAGARRIPASARHRRARPRGLGRSRVHLGHNWTAQGGHAHPQQPG